MKPQKSEYGAFYEGYIALVEETDLLTALRTATQRGQDFWPSITEKQGDHRYAAGKWSVKELLLHIIDTERIMGYRALCFARGETASLPGFDEDAFAANSNADERNLKSIVNEYMAVRQATVQLFAGFDPKVFSNLGTANGQAMSARAAGFIIVGHEMHHMKVVRERYL